ncbi:MAG TPA: RidA family protein [Actinomycetales bacterium]|nr:RidA family protein [Actinomycetales bacterium]
MSSWKSQEIRTEAAPAPAFSFSQGVRRGPLVQVSGQGPVDPATGEYLYQGDVGAQTTQTLNNVLAILRAGGAELGDVLQLRVYLTKQEHFGPMNEAYGKFIADNIGDGIAPCRTTVFTGLPRNDMLVEIDALAAVDPSA